MPSSPLEPDLNSTCESVVLEFEKARRAGRDFDLAIELKEVKLEQRPRLAAELACIDLELNSSAGRLPVVSQIVLKYPEYFESEMARAVVAVEHFRLCCVEGTPIGRDAIAKLYDVALDEIPDRQSVQNSPSRPRAVDFPRVGDIFCNYPLLAELGRGALARVYLAQQPDLAQRLVVLKVTQRSTSEADKLARLQHTGIIPVYSIHRQGELTCICMPYLGALTLANLIDDGRLLSNPSDTTHGLVSTIVSKRLSTIVGNVQNTTNTVPSLQRSPSQQAPIDGVKPTCATITQKNISVQSTNSAEQFSAQLGTDELIDSLNLVFVAPGPIVAAVELISKIAETLAYTHKRSIVHRDLKPENILIANDGQPVLLDFNLAAKVSDARCEIAGGTLPYMSAQHLRSLNTNGQASASDDVFSVGVLLYQLLSGKLPFASAPFAMQDLEKLALSRGQLPANLRTLNSAIPASLASIVSKCLAYEASDRYPSSIELLDDLTRYRSNQVLRYAADRSPSERIRKWVRRNPILTSSTSLIVCFGLVACSWISALMYSRSRVDKLTALQAAQSLPAQMGSAITLLQSPGREPELLQEGMIAGQAIVATWMAEDAGGMRLKPVINHLDAGRAMMVKRQLHDLLRMMSDVAGQMSVVQPKTQDRMAANVSRLSLLADLVGPKFGESNNANDLRDLFIQALNARNEKRFADWESLSEQMVAEQPQDPSQWFTLGAARWTLGKFEAARHAFDVAEKLQPGSAVALFWRGVCELQTGKSFTAKNDFSLCLDSRPDWMPAIYNRALASRMRGDYAEALADVKRIIDMGQGTTRVFSLQSQLQQQAGNEAESRASRELALNAKPQDADDWVSRGILKLPNDPTAALEDFVRAREMNPAHAGAIQNIAHIQSEITHENQAAIEALTQLISLRPNSASPIASRGIVLGRISRAEDAIADAKVAEKLVAETLRPNAIEMLQIAGIYSLACEDFDSRKSLAIDWLAKAIAADPRLRSIAATDPDLKNLIGMEQFRALTLPQPELLQNE